MAILKSRFLEIEIAIEATNEWQNRKLKSFYPFIFVDCLYVNIRKDMEVKNCAVYVILGYDIDGVQDILGIWNNETEGKHHWMQIFDEIKLRGVEDILFMVDCKMKLNNKK